MTAQMKRKNIRKSITGPNDYSPINELEEWIKIVLKILDSLTFLLFRFFFYQNKLLVL